MPIVDMKDMLLHAYRHGYAVGAFDVVSFILDRYLMRT
jgi:fructose-bisphosphate aldolase class II